MQIKKKLVWEELHTSPRKKSNLSCLCLIQRWQNFSKIFVTGDNQLFLVRLPRNSNCFWPRWKLLCNLEMAVHMIFSPMLLNVILMEKSSWESITLQQTFSVMSTTFDDVWHLCIVSIQYCLFHFAPGDSRHDRSLHCWACSLETKVSLHSILSLTKDN